MRASYKLKDACPWASWQEGERKHHPDPPAIAVVEVGDRDGAGMSYTQTKTLQRTRKK